MLWEKVGRFKGKIRLSHTTHTSPCPRHRPRPARSPSLLRVRAVCPSKSCVRGSGAAVATKGASASGCAAGLSCTGGRGLAADASPPLPPQCRWLDRAVPVPNAHWWLIPMHWDWERLSPSPDRIFFSGFAAGQPSSPPARILLGPAFGSGYAWEILAGRRLALALPAPWDRASSQLLRVPLFPSFSRAGAGCPTLKVTLPAPSPSLTSAVLHDIWRDVPDQILQYLELLLLLC